LLYQLSYDPMSNFREPVLAGFPMKLMAPAARAELFEFQPTGIIAPVLLGRVISLAAHCAFKRNYRPVSLRLLGHCTTSSSLLPNWHASPGRVGRPVTGRPDRYVRAYASILVTAPAPTVRPPSRIANRSPSSIATGVISSTPIWMLSPGITISVPSGKVIVPVTSVVRM